MRDHCEAELVLNPVVVCDNTPTYHFDLGKDWVPVMAGPPLPGWPSIDACDEHVDSIEMVLAKTGHQPKRTKV